MQDEIVTIHEKYENECSKRKNLEQALVCSRNNSELTFKKLEESTQLLDLRNEEIKAMKAELDNFSMKLDARNAEYSEHLEDLENELERMKEELEVSENDKCEKEGLLDVETDRSNGLLGEL